MIFNSIDFFPNCYIGIFLCATKAEENMASCRKLLFLYVLECKIYTTIIIFNNCDICNRFTFGKT